MAITHIASATAAGGQNGATTGSVDSTGANLAVIFTSSLTFGTPTFSDSKGNTYTSLTAYTASIFRAQQAYCENPTVGSGHTFTVGGTDVYAGVSASVFDGVATSSAFDSENGTAGSTSGTVSTGSVTPPDDGCLLTTALYSNNGSSFSIDSSFTASSRNHAGGTSVGLGWAYKIQTTASSENPTWTSNGDNLGASIAVFLPAAGGGGAAQNYLTLLGVG